MPFDTNKKKSARSALSRLRTPSRKGSKLYRPPGSFPFPDARGKVVADLYLTVKSYLKCVTLCFDDNTELVIDLEPCLSFKANYSDWKNGNQRVIKRWPCIDVPPTPPKNPSKRPLGLYRGQIWIAPDFDAPMKLVDDDEGRMALVPDSSSSFPKSKAHKSRRKAKRT